MWKILRAEFSYNRYWLLTALCGHCVLLGVFTTVTVLQGRIEYKALPVIAFMMGIITYLIMVFVMPSRERQRRRLHSLLPLSGVDIGISRVLFAFILWITLVIVLGLNLLMVKLDTFEIDHKTFTSHLLMDILAIQGLMLILNAKYHITRDIGSCIKRRFTILTISSDKIPGALLAFIIAAVVGFLTFIQIGSIEPMRTIVLSTAVSPAGNFALNSLGIILSYLSISTFIRRRSFLV